MPKPVKTRGARSLVGERFGRWLVVSEIRGRDGYCSCQCDCGTERRVARGSLVFGISLSCGCATHKDFVGQQFGKLLAVKKIKITLPNGKRTAGYLCRCDCGKSKTALVCDLVTGSVKSCGCLRFNTIAIGSVFERLTVVRTFHDRYGDKTARCVCQCVCGNKTTVRARALLTGNTRSCGCLRDELAHKGLLPGESARNALLRRCIENAKATGREFSISAEQAFKLFESTCYYCGIGPSMVCPPPSKPRRPRGDENYAYNGLDRKNNHKDYVISNVVSCCWDCNRAKRDQTVTEFLEWVMRIRRYKRRVIPVKLPLWETVSNRFSFGDAWCSYRQSAEKRGIEFRLTKSQAIAMFKSHCSYCMELPSNGPKGKQYSGIDRVDNSGAYDLPNVRAACVRCNRAKGNKTMEEFISWALRVQRYQRSRSGKSSGA